MKDGPREIPLAHANASPVNQNCLPSLHECTNVPKCILTSSETPVIANVSRRYDEPGTSGPLSHNASHFDPEREDIPFTTEPEADEGESELEALECDHTLDSSPLESDSDGGSYSEGPESKEEPTLLDRSHAQQKPPNEFEAIFKGTFGQAGCMGRQEV